MRELIDTKNLSPEQLKALLSCIWDESQHKFLYGQGAAEYRIRRASQQFKEIT